MLFNRRQIIKSAVAAACFGVIPAVAKSNGDSGKAELHGSALCPVNVTPNRTNLVYRFYAVDVVLSEDPRRSLEHTWRPVADYITENGGKIQSIQAVLSVNRINNRFEIIAYGHIPPISGTWVKDFMQPKSWGEERWTEEAIKGRPRFE